MDLYIRKKRWKLFLFASAALIVSASLYYTNILVNEIRKDERQKVEIWADAIQRKAELVNFTSRLFEQLKNEEHKRVLHLVEAQRLIVNATNNDYLNFFLSIISDNTTIPVIQVDQEDNIVSARNVDFDPDTVPRFEGATRQAFSVYPPIVVNYYRDKKFFQYYKDSNLFSELKIIMDDLIRVFFSEAVMNSASVPVIITDSSQQRVIQYGNLDEKKMKDPAFVRKTIESMASQNQPIVVSIAGLGTQYIYYQDSFILTQLQYYPYVQFLVIGLFLFIAYLLFSYARKSEQNQVWVGMAKETAHQLGTPMSSMVGWIELLKLKGMDPETVGELEKDVQRLETVTDRFSKIGSTARLEKQNIIRVIYDTVAYFRSRTSQKVTFSINPGKDQELIVPINLHLFEWVIENLCKNAVDAMDGNGVVSIEITDDSGHIHIDVSDTGKGIPKGRFKTIFRPGFTSKTRGWGLGLTLSKRIIENYHSGKIFVKNSTLSKGTTFRIILKK